MSQSRKRKSKLFALILGWMGVALSIFGQFTQPGAHLHDKCVERIDNFYGEFNTVVAHLCSKHKNLEGKIFVNYANVAIAVGRYINDLSLFEKEHRIDKFHRSKILAYQVRWFLLYPPLCSSVSREDFEKLDESEQAVVLSLNHLPVEISIERFLDFDVLLRHEMRPHLREKIEETLERLYYYIKTNAYDAKVATLYFEMILVAG
jgi:hypothetical protein